MERRNVCIALLLVCGACCAVAAEPNHGESSIADQRDLTLTVYNNDYGLVRDVREITLPKGIVALDFHDVAAQIDATSVAFRALRHPDSLAILEQNYRYDLLSPQTLLQRYIGRTLHYVRDVEEGEGVRREERSGELLSLEGGQIVRFGNAIEIDPKGTIVVDEVPGDLLSRPTLVWLLENKSAKAQEVEVSYLTTGISWHADYVAVLDKDERHLDLTGWVTLDNRSGATYRDAGLKLVAGDVRRVADTDAAVPMMEMRMAAKPRPAFEEQGFFEYHLYTLGRRTTLANNETKQIVLLRGDGIGVAKRLTVDSSAQVYSAMPNQEEPDVDVTLRFANRADNHLGVALPAGRVRVYKGDSDDALQLVGEERIGHTPRDEEVDLRVGKAFDVVAERRQTAFRRRGDRSSESGFEVEVRNHKDEEVTVLVVEHLPGDWSITEESRAHRKIDAGSIEYTLAVPARGSARVAYTALVSW